MASLNKVWLTASACVAFLFFAFFASVPLGQTVKLVLFRSPQIFDTNQIQASRQNIWADLSENETDEVLNFLYSKSGLNLTETSQATQWAPI
jgi:primary-amine oxidase